MEGSFNKINKFIFICKKWKLNFIKSMIWIIQPQGGGGGTLIFSSYVGSGPASTVHPKKIFEILATPKISPILYLDLKAA